MNMASSPIRGLPLSSLRLLVPPLRLVSAWMWQVAEQRNIMHYGKLEEFVTLVTEMVPDLLSYKQMVQLILGLRARFVLELCRDEPPAELQTIQSHLDRISQFAEPHMHGGNRDPEVEAAEGNFVELVQTLLKNTEDRKHFFQDVFPEQYGPKYDTALQILVWEFLSRLEQLLPVPDFKQTASWLGDDVSSVLEDSMQSVSNPEYLKDLLQYNQCLGYLKKAHSCNSIMGDTILSTLSCPPTVRVVIGLNEEANSDGAGSKADENECMEHGAVKNLWPERDVVGGLTDEVRVEQEKGGERQNEEGNKETIDTNEPKDIQRDCRNLRSSQIELQEWEGRIRAPLPSERTHEKRSEIKASTATPWLHTCSHCGKSFGFPSLLKRHEKIHTGERPFNCIKCGKNFITAWDLTKHQRIHSSTLEPQSHSCSCCGRTCRSSSELIRHERIHTGVRVFNCTKCGKNFHTAWDLRRHQQIHSSTRKSKPRSCSKCEKNFSRSSDLTRHLVTHTGECSFSCPDCGKSYKSASNLKNHQRNHTGERPYLCSYCGKSFVQKVILESHLRTHTGERPYCCSHCGKRFNQAQILARHMRMHTGERPYVCEICGKAFLASGELLLHRRIHTGERPHRCSQCGKGFRSSCGLRRHRQTHSGERPYSCTHCKKQFADTSGLSRHMRIHTGEKPHQCSQCGKRFAQVGNMKIHLRVHRQA